MGVVASVFSALSVVAVATSLVYDVWESITESSGGTTTTTTIGWFFTCSYPSGQCTEASWQPVNVGSCVVDTTSHQYRFVAMRWATVVCGAFGSLATPCALGAAQMTRRRWRTVFALVWSALSFLLGAGVIGFFVYTIMTFQYCGGTACSISSIGATGTCTAVFGVGFFVFCGAVGAQLLAMVLLSGSLCCCTRWAPWRPDGSPSSVPKTKI